MRTWLVLAGIVVAVSGTSAQTSLPAYAPSGFATEALHLHESPPRRPVLFPFVVLPPKESGEMLEAGETFTVLRDETRHDFLQEPTRWLYIETRTGAHGWINIENPIEWLPLIADSDHPDRLMVVEATIAYLNYLLENLDDPEVTRKAMGALEATVAALEESDR